MYRRHAEITVNTTMKAVVYTGKKEIQVKEIKRPHKEDPNDAVLRVTETGICGSDLHMYEGRTMFKEGGTVGHEIMGVIEEVGENVKQIKEGDRVVLPFNIACGTCYNCARGYTSACLFMNPDMPHAAYGYTGMGPFQGGQTEYVRVPFADVNCLKLPGTPGDEFEDDFVLLSDVFPTGFYATELANVRPGSTVAIFGAGPVGLLAAHSALIKGAAEVYVADFHGNRLEVAAEFGAVPIDIRNGDPVEQIKEMRKSNRLIQGSLRPGEEKMDGVMCGIDAVGYQARSDTDYEREDPTQVINNLVKLVNPTGSIGIVGVYVSPDPGAHNKKQEQGIFEIPIAQIFDKGLTIGAGQTPVRKYSRELLNLIIAGKAEPSRIVSQKIRISESPQAYERFDRREEGYVKVVISMLK